MAAKSRTRRADVRGRLRQVKKKNRELRARLKALTADQGILATHSRRLHHAHKLAQEFQTLNLDRIGEVASTKVPAVFLARGCSIYLYDYGSNDLTLLAQNGKVPLEGRVSTRVHKQCVMAHVLENRKTVCIAGFHAWQEAHGVRFRRPYAKRYATETCVSLPLMTANFVVGILNVSDRDRGKPFDAEDLHAMEEVGRSLAMAIRNSKLFKDVRNQAHTDGLTQLHNRRAFQESLRAEIHRASRYGRPLALIMLDVDLFKALNDAFGHQAGDTALSELARVVRESLRREDFAARYGGDEVGIILPETKLQGALMVVQRLLAAVRGHSFVHDGKALPVSISAGVALFLPEMTITQFIGAADEALYRAKQTGRNRYEVSGDSAAE